MSEIVMITSKELSSLYRFKKLWTAGWVVAALAGLFGGYQYSKVRAHHEAMSEIEKAKAGIQEAIQAQQQQTQAFVVAWENQQKTADTLMTMGSYFASRQSLVEQNRGAMASSRQSR